MGGEENKMKNNKKKKDPEKGRWFGGEGGEGWRGGG